MTDIILIGRHKFRLRPNGHYDIWDYRLRDRWMPVYNEMTVAFLEHHTRITKQLQEKTDRIEILHSEMAKLTEQVRELS